MSCVEVLSLNMKHDVLTTEPARWYVAGIYIIGVLAGLFWICRSADLALMPGCLCPQLQYAQQVSTVFCALQFLCTLAVHACNAASGKSAAWHCELLNAVVLQACPASSQFTLQLLWGC